MLGSMARILPRVYNFVFSTEIRKAGRARLFQMGERGARSQSVSQPVRSTILFLA
jgi:hypothetical protein